MYYLAWTFAKSFQNAYICKKVGLKIEIVLLKRLMKTKVRVYTRQRLSSELSFKKKDAYVRAYAS